MAQTSTLLATRGPRNLVRAFFAVADEIDEKQRPGICLAAIAQIALDIKAMPQQTEPARVKPAKAAKAPARKAATTPAAAAAELVATAELPAQPAAPQVVQAGNGASAQT